MALRNWVDDPVAMYSRKALKGQREDDCDSDEVQNHVSK